MRETPPDYSLSTQETPPFNLIHREVAAAVLSRALGSGLMGREGLSVWNNLHL